MKYIIFKCDPLEIPVVFHEYLTHDTIDIAPDHRGIKPVPVAAGFVDGDGRCFGRSVSMKLASRPQDAAIITAAREFTTV